MDVENAGEFRALVCRDVVGMHAADAATAKDCNSDQFVLPKFWQ
jgi:hypothetical protein